MVRATSHSVVRLRKSIERARIMAAASFSPNLATNIQTIKDMVTYAMYGLKNELHHLLLSLGKLLLSLS